MCRVRPTTRSIPVVAVANHDISTTMDNMHKAADAMIQSSSSSQNPNNTNNLRVLICSENVPPQVNGIARRVGMYADGLRNLGCDVGKLLL